VPFAPPDLILGDFLDHDPAPAVGGGELAPRRAISEFSSRCRAKRLKGSTHGATARKTPTTRAYTGSKPEGCGRGWRRERQAIGQVHCCSASFSLAPSPQMLSLCYEMMPRACDGGRSQQASPHRKAEASARRGMLAQEPLGDICSVQAPAPVSGRSLQEDTRSWASRL
jgi:hypothetical protein